MLTIIYKGKTYHISGGPQATVDIDAYAEIEAELTKLKKELKKVAAKNAGQKGGD